MLESGSCLFDLLADGVFPLVDAVRVEILQHAHAVARASGDLAGCSSGVQPQRQGGMPQVVMCSSRRLNAESKQFSDHEQAAAWTPPQDPDSALRVRLD
jgi:hypothetical protein